MLYFTRWKALAIILTALVVCLCAVPNFFSEATVKTWPSWAQRRLVLGLDLQGGSHLLLEVDANSVKKDKLDQVRDDVRRTLREARIGYTGLATRPDSVEVRVKDSDLQNALTKLRELSQPLGGLLGSSGQRSLEVSDAGGGLIRLTVPPAAITDRVRQSVDQSIQIVERRVNELGTVEPLIQREGADRILVQVPGLQDPTRLKELLGKTAKLDFRMVDTTVPPDQAVQGRVPPDSEVLMSSTSPKTPYVIKKQVVVSGGDLTDAQPGFDQRSGEPIVSFRFNTAGSRKFAQATSENVGQPFAIVLDNEVISAPVIREPITGGSGQISGSFTVQQANDLAILLRAGALPAPLTIIEERTVGPGLGQDSIEKGELAAYVGSIMVIVFMLADLSAVRRVRQYRGCHQCRDDLRPAVAAQRHADLARHCRHRADGRHRGGLQRADLRAHPRGIARRPYRDFRDRCRVQAGAVDHPRFQYHHLHRRRGAVLHRHRSGARLRGDARHRHHHHGLYRVYADPADRRGLGPVEAAAKRADLRMRSRL